MAKPQDVPPHDAPDAAFHFSDPDDRDAAMAWARGILADVAFYPDAQLVRACRVIITNDHPTRSRDAVFLLAAIRADAGKVVSDAA